MDILRLALVFCLATGAPSIILAQQAEQRATIQPEAWRLVLLANAARNEQGIKPLHEWAETFERYWTHQLSRVKERAEAKMRITTEEDKSPKENS